MYNSTICIFRFIIMNKNKNCKLKKKVFMSTKTTSSHEGDFRAERIRILVHNFFLCLVETVGVTHAPRRNTYLLILFSEIMKQISLEMSLSYLKNMPFCYPSER